MSSRALVTEDLAALMREGVATFLGTSDERGTPEVTRAAGVAPAGDARLRLLISAEATTTLGNLEAGSEVAVLVTDITNYRSVQWKGRLVEVVSALTPGDLALSDATIERFRTSAELVGLDGDTCWRLWPTRMVPVVVEVDEVFDQTPGPAAGQVLDT